MVDRRYGVSLICILLLSLCHVISTYEDFDDEKEKEDVDDFDRFLSALRRSDDDDDDDDEDDVNELLEEIRQRKRSNFHKFLKALENRHGLHKTGNTRLAAEHVRKFLHEFNRTYTEYLHNDSIADWNYSVDMTKPKAEKKTKAKLALSKWLVNQTEYARMILTKQAPGLTKDEKRQLQTISKTLVTRNTTLEKEISNIENAISSIYSSAVIKDKNGNVATGENAVVAIFTKSRNCSELKSAWKQWRDQTGKKIRSKYEKLVQLLNKKARENGYPDFGYHEWKTDFEKENFNRTVLEMYSKIAPLYKELHAYVRYKLRLYYPDCGLTERGPIPAHLLGNTWAQQWNTIIDIVKPYRNAKSPNITKALNAKGYTVHKMYTTSEAFFYSIGLYNMTKKFWERSMLTKPKGRTVDCHGSANDFYTWDDFRIKMCTVITHDDFKTVHHEMGHITYYMCYRNQTAVFREGANSGFHEAIGDTIALSVMTPKHLKRLKLLDESDKSMNSFKSDINVLMEMALAKIAFLPFALTVDTWRWNVFNGGISPRHYNRGWWRLRRHFQGIKPPLPRSEEDFDAGAKYHVAHNVPYIRYFTSFIMQFQFYEAMCKASGHVGPLHKCDFYKSKAAGHLLKRMLSLGSSKPWPEAMRVMTGQSHMRLDSLNRYFRPLARWLKRYRRRRGYPIGWSE